MDHPSRLRRAASSVALGLASATVPSPFDSATQRGSSPTVAYIVPHLKPGDRIATVFSKTVAFMIPDFDPKVSLTSGTDTIVFRSVGDGGITPDENYEYDGSPPGKNVVDVRDAGRTNCVDGKCRTNDQTSAPLFNPLLWGAMPERLTVGRRGLASIDKPREIGPAGTEVVTVARLDPAQDLITLIREGAGDGPSTDDARMSVLTITVGRRSMKVKVVPGRAHWTGYATVVRGMILADQTVVERSLDLVTNDGQHVPARQRTYTTFVRDEGAAVAV